jgi:hypothetical protein
VVYIEVTGFPSEYFAFSIVLGVLEAASAKQ